MVLEQTYEQVKQHIYKRFNNPKRSTGNNDIKINFVAPGKNNVSAIRKGKHYGNMGILTEANDWIDIADLGTKLKFPDIVQVRTSLRPDLSIYFKSIKRIINKHAHQKKELGSLVD